ncbi:MAG: YfcE family phosphodiesterase [Clostridiales bacterium]|nr:YfcE family phosphodiesterase [Clostridiales bacterium]
MKKYLVCSDIHEREDILRYVVMHESPLDGVIVAGDLQMETHDIENLVRANNRRCDIYMVCGNCDRYTFTAAQLPPILAFPISETHRVFLTHGHLFPGRGDHTLMGETARQKNCDIVIYGHTHRAVDTTENGIRFINGGALMRGGYAILTVGDDESVDVKLKLI